MKRSGQVGRRLRITVAVLLLAPGGALANVGIPMLAYAWPVAWVLLVPVIGLEALVARRVLRASWPASLRLSGLSNLVSTLVGIPLAWGAVLLLGAVVHTVASVLPRQLQRWVEVPFYAAWVPPLRDLPPWVVPAAGALLCVPFLLASVGVERRVAQRITAFDRAELRRWAWQANLLTYSLVAAGLGVIALLAVA